MTNLKHNYQLEVFPSRSPWSPSPGPALQVPKNLKCLRSGGFGGGRQPPRGVLGTLSKLQNRVLLRQKVSPESSTVTPPDHQSIFLIEALINPALTNPALRFAPTRGSLWTPLAVAELDGCSSEANVWKTGFGSARPLGDLAEGGAPERSTM